MKEAEGENEISICRPTWLSEGKKTIRSSPDAEKPTDDE